MKQNNHSRKQFSTAAAVAERSLRNPNVLNASTQIDALDKKKKNEKKQNLLYRDNSMMKNSFVQM